MNISACAAQLHQLLGLTVPPVALAFRPAAPAGVRRVATPSPAGCAYWKRAAQVLLVAEAARAAGIGHEGATLGRPACAMIPEVLRSAHGTTSLGCIGNRVYTELADDELYFAIPGPAIAEVVGKLDAIISANRELQQYHRSRAHASQP